MDDLTAAIEAAVGRCVDKYISERHMGATATASTAKASTAKASTAKASTAKASTGVPPAIKEWYQRQRQLAEARSREVDMRDSIVIQRKQIRDLKAQVKELEESRNGALRELVRASDQVRELLANKDEAARARVTAPKTGVTEADLLEWGGVDILRNLSSYMHKRAFQLKRLSEDVISISGLLENEQELTKKLQGELAAEKKGKAELHAMLRAEKKRVSELHAMLRAEEKAENEQVGKLQNALDRERALARNRAMPHAKVVEAGRERNTTLASLFRELSSYSLYECQKDAYALVARRLEEHYCEVTSGMEALGIQDIGNSSARKIQEWLDTGRIALLEEFRATKGRND